MTLFRNDCTLIVQALETVKRKFREYDYPSTEIKQQRISEVTAAINKVRDLRKIAPRSSNT